MPEPRSKWTLTASCSACRRKFSLTSTAVLVRDSLLGQRGTVLDALGERWPESGRLLHPQCFARQFGRRALWTAFLRGRFDKGIARADRSSGDGHLGEVVADEGRVWQLSVNCCDCVEPVEPSGPAVVREEQAPHRWRWVPMLQERRPGQRRVYHLRCFVASHGRAAAYALLGLDLWERTPKAFKNIAGAINPLP
jgi:hypothetical protein